MKTSMLEYLKIILTKVSFDRRLFRKEYKKSFNQLSDKDIIELKRWLRQQGLVPLCQSADTKS